MRAVWILHMTTLIAVVYCKKERYGTTIDYNEEEDDKVNTVRAEEITERNDEHNGENNLETGNSDENENNSHGQNGEAVQSARSFNNDVNGWPGRGGLYGGGGGHGGNYGGSLGGYGMGDANNDLPMRDVGMEFGGGMSRFPKANRGRSKSNGFGYFGNGAGGFTGLGGIGMQQNAWNGENSLYAGGSYANNPYSNGMGQQWGQGNSGNSYSYKGYINGLMPDGYGKPRWGQNNVGSGYMNDNGGFGSSFSGSSFAVAQLANTLTNAIRDLAFAG